MWKWLQRVAGHKPGRSPTDEKRKFELRDLELAVREREIKLGAIQRVVESESDPITALEVVTVATHRGKLPPNLAPRRAANQSPLEQLAMRMLEKRLEEDPTDALERIIERRERLEDAADRLSGGRRREDETGNTFVDVARALANSELGTAIGAVVGAGMQQHFAAAAAVGGQRINVQPQPGGDTPAAEPAATPELGSWQAAPTPVQAPESSPTSFRVGVALRTLRSLAPPAGARWLLGLAESNETVGQLLDPLLAAEPEAVPVLLASFVAEAGADPRMAEWLPIVQYLHDNLAWTLGCHAELRRLLEAPADGPEAANA